MKKTPRYIIILQMCTINVNHMKYGSWDMECDRLNFLSFWVIFLPFHPTNDLKNQNFEKMKKLPADIIVLHMCTINDNHIMYGSWDMECNGHNFLNCFVPFYLPPPLTTQTIKIFKKWKKHLKILSFYTRVP